MPIPLSERTNHLAQYGFICDCPLCENERAVPPA
jgi:hypothetical protein